MLRGLCEGGSRHVRLTSAPVRLSDHRGAQKGEISCNVRRPLHLHFHLILTAGRATRPAGRGLPDRATYVFSTPTDGRTDKPSTCLPACLPDLVAGVRCPGDAPLMPSNRCFARPEPPVRLPPSLRRQTEKAKRRREKKSWLINPATTVGALALTRLLIGRGGRPGPRRWLARPLR